MQNKVLNTFQLMGYSAAQGAHAEPLEINLNFFIFSLVMELPIYGLESLRFLREKNIIK